MKQKGYNLKLSTALILAVIVPQLGLNMLIPSLPLIANHFQSPVETAQFLITLYLAGYAFSILFSGFLADKFGARRVQIFGLGLFIIATILCLVTSSITLMIFLRFLQALGGGSATVLTRLIVQKEYPEENRMAILTTLTSAIALTPCLTPIVGGFLTEQMSWYGIFFVTALIGSIAALMFLMFVPETQLSDKKHPLSLNKIINDYRESLSNRSYLVYVTSISLVTMAQVIFLSYSAYLFQTTMGISPLIYGLFLAISAIGYVCGSMMVRHFSKKYSLARLLILGSVACCVGCILLIATAFIAPNSAYGIIIPMIIVMFGIGITIPVSQAGLLSTVSNNSGNSSSLFFFIQLMAGTCYGFLAGQWLHMDSISLAIIISFPCFLFSIIIMARSYGTSVFSEYQTKTSHEEV